jgi:hypothetical protein
VLAVVAHSRKSFGRGLPELREILAREGVTDPLWYEVKKSGARPASKKLRIKVRPCSVTVCVPPMSNELILLELRGVWAGSGRLRAGLLAAAGPAFGLPRSFRAIWRG